MSALRRTLLLATVVAAAAGLAAPLAALACGSAGYTYAGVFGNRKVAGVGATLTALTEPEVLGGHVAAWVGVGGVGQGPNNTDEWIQVGYSAFPGTGSGSLYYEVARPGMDPQYFEIETGIIPGLTRRVMVAEMRSTPGAWRVWVDGKFVTEPIWLPGSHHAWLPVATAESWGGGNVVCNSYSYSFNRVRVVHDAGGGWLRLNAGTSFQDEGYRVLYRAPGSFLADRSTDGTSSPLRQTFGVKR